MIVFCKRFFLVHDWGVPRKKKTADWHGCPIRFAMGIFGDQWSLLVLRDLMFKGKRYFSEFADSEEGIATNILTNRLQTLCEEGIIIRDRDPMNRSKYIYGLTKKGKDLLPVMFAIIDWSFEYDSRSEAPPEFVEALRKDPENLRKRILEKL